MRHAASTDGKEEIAQLLGKTPPCGARRIRTYKTSHNFDGTYQNPQWLGSGWRMNSASQRREGTTSVVPKKMKRDWL